MKILHVCNRFYPAVGGVETYVFKVAKRFTEDGHFINILCSDMVGTNSNDRFKNKVGTVEGIHFVRLRGFKFFGVDATTFIPYLPIFLALNVKKYDIIQVHSYGYFVSWMSILICKLFNKTVIYNPYYANETVLPRIVKIIFDFMIAGWSFRMATEIVALTKVEKDILVKKFRVERRKISVIPSGIDIKNGEDNIWTKENKNKVLIRNGINNKKRNVIVISRLAKNKGHIYLLKAFEKIYGCNLIIIGKDWGEKENLVKYIQKKKIYDVYFLENVSDVEKNNLLKSADVFVLPSIGGEAFGIVLLEAMANEIPVVASDVGGIRDLIKEGKNGYLVKPKSVQQIIKKINILINNKNIETMKKFCRGFASQYSWEKIYIKINVLYKNVLDKK